MHLSFLNPKSAKKGCSRNSKRKKAYQAKLLGMNLVKPSLCLVTDLN